MFPSSGQPAETRSCGAPNDDGGGGTSYAFPPHACYSQGYAQPPRSSTSHFRTFARCTRACVGLTALFLGWSYAPNANCKTLITGTAIFLNKNGDMLTNRHVVQGCSHLLVKPHDGLLYKAQITSIGGAFDMALIKEEKFRPSQVSWIRVGEDNRVGMVKPGEAVLYGGYDQEPITDIDVSNGEVVELPDRLNPDKAHVSNMVSGATHGASGSGVFERTEGLVGLIYSGFINIGLNSSRHEELSKFYGDNIINFYNADAIVQFLQHESSYKPQIFYRVNPLPVIRLENMGHISLSSALVVCYED
jgi:hypothetical protein